VRRWLAFVLIAVLLVGVPATARPMAVATCSVKNARTGAITHTLQAAVNATLDRDTLLIKGTCIGKTAIRSKSDYQVLRLKGVPTTEQPTPTLDGGGIGRVLAVYATTVLRDLTITNGFTTGRGGGIRFTGEGAKLSLKGDTSVTGNTAGYGGGISAEFSAGFTPVIVMHDSSSVSGNTAGYGGGIYNGWHTGLDIYDSSSVTGNTAVRGGGIYAFYSFLSLYDSSSVSGNTAGEVGGGIVNDTGVLYVCSDLVAISPNDPDDPPETLPCP